MPEELSRNFTVKLLCLCSFFLVKLSHSKTELLRVLLQVLKANATFTEDDKFRVSDFSNSRLNTKRAATSVYYQNFGIFVKIIVNVFSFSRGDVPEFVCRRCSDWESRLLQKG